MTHYAKELLDAQDAPALFDSSLTVAGLVSHGAKRYPTEWEAVLKSRSAMRRLMDWLVSSRPDDGEFIRLLEVMLKAVAHRG